jgi:hypothetical protein
MELSSVHGCIYSESCTVMIHADRPDVMNSEI